MWIVKTTIHQLSTEHIFKSIFLIIFITFYDNNLIFYIYFLCCVDSVDSVDSCFDFKIFFEKKNLYINRVFSTIHLSNYPQTTHKTLN
jgi:hypothetical protein